MKIPPVKQNIQFLERLGYIVMTKIELDSIIRAAKLGKTFLVDKNGKPRGVVEV